MSHNIKPGVATGDQVQEIFNYAKEKGFALPAVNVTGSSTINGVIETAAKLNAPVIIQFSNGGAQFNAGKGLSNASEKAAIAGGIAGALHIHTLAEAYGATVILHTDHCAKKLLPWIDGLLDASEKHFAETGKPLFSSHMLDLSEEPLHENVEICAKYFTEFAKLDMAIEIELGYAIGSVQGGQPCKGVITPQGAHVDEAVYRGIHGQDSFRSPTPAHSQYRQGERQPQIIGVRRPFREYGQPPR